MYVIDESIDELSKILLLILGCAVQVLSLAASTLLYVLYKSKLTSG